MSQSARAVSEASPPTVSDYSKLVRNHWLVLALGLLLGVALAFGYLAVRPTSYTSTSSVLLTQTAAVDGSQTAAARSANELNLDTEAQLVRSDAVMQAAIAELGAEESTRQFARRVSVSVPPNSEVIVVTFVAQEPDVAERGADAVASAYLAARADGAQRVLDGQVEVIEGQLTELRAELATAATDVTETTPDSADRLVAAAERDRVLSEIAATDTRRRELQRVQVNPGTVVTAATPAQPDNQSVTAIALVSGPFAGLLVGLGVALLLDRTRRVVRDGLDVSAVSPYPVAARLPKGFGSRTGPGTAKEAHAFLRLRTQIGFYSFHPPRVVLVVGVSPGAAAHGVATELSKAYAQGGTAVTRTCTDPATPRLCGDQQPSAGAVRPASQAQAPAAEGPDADRVLVLHAPSTRDSLEAQGLLPRADVVLLVVEEGVSRIDDVQNATQHVTEAQLHIDAANTASVVTVLVPRPSRAAGRRTSRRGRKARADSSAALTVHLGGPARAGAPAAGESDRPGSRSAALERS